MNGTRTPITGARDMADRLQNRAVLTCLLFAMRRLALLALLLVTAHATALAQDDERLPLDRLMSPAIQKAVGVDKLTPAERDKLRDYIQAFYRVAFEDGKRSAIRQQVARPESPTLPREPVTTRTPQVVVIPRDSNPVTSRRPLAVDPPRTASSSPSVIESRIDGEFTGWEGETIFRLQNGQIWQQSSYAYTYHYAYRPEVLIYRSGTGFKMKVDGVERAINVERLR